MPQVTERITPLVQVRCDLGCNTTSLEHLMFLTSSAVMPSRAGATAAVTATESPKLPLSRCSEMVNWIMVYLVIICEDGKWSKWSYFAKMVRFHLQRDQPLGHGGLVRRLDGERALLHHLQGQRQPEGRNWVGSRTRDWTNPLGLICLW